MKIKFLPLIIMLSKMSLYGVFVQCLFITVLLASEGNAQKSKSINEVYLTVGFEKSQLLEIFETIESETSFEFSYYKKDLPLKRLTLERAERSLSETLHVIADQAGLKFRRVNDNILVDVNKKHGKHSTKEVLVKEDVNISGTITDETGVGLPVASIIIKGTATGTTSDIEGHYKLTVPDDAVLTISFVGYTSQEIEIAGRSQIDVQMVVDAQALEEVVVVGFGTQKKSNLSGSIVSVKVGEEIASRPIVNLNQALQGIAAGLNVVTASGQPGNTQTSLEIRGRGTINGASPPLVLVDNVEMSLADINPADVGAVTVLKDAAASSIYGARAAWGVVLIELKKPERDQEIKFDYRSTVSISSPVSLPEKATVREFVTLLDEIGINNYWSGQDVQTWKNYLDDYDANPQNYPTGVVLDEDGFNYSLTETRPIKQLLDDRGVYQKHDLNISGGSGKAAYRVSLGYAKENGVIVTDNDRYSRYNVNAYMDVDIAKNLTSMTNIFYRRGDRSNPIGFYQQAIEQAVWLPTGFYTLEDGRTLPFDSPDNLERLLPHTTVKEDVARIIERITYEPIEGLKLTSDFTFERGNTRTQAVNIQLPTVRRLTYLPNTVNPDGTSVSKAFAESERYAINLYANYNKTLNGVHNLGAMIGYNRESSFVNAFSTNRLNLLSTDVPSVDAASGAFGGSDSFVERSVLGYFGRLQYNFKERYFIEGNMRYDGSSRFPTDDRFGLFASASAAWVVTNESFLANTDWLSFLKFRGSYGQIGNQAGADAYPYLSQWNPTETWLLNDGGERQTTIRPGLLVSPSFTWETVQKTNLAVDLALLDHRLSVTAEVFRNKTINMLLPSQELPAILGTNAPVTNAADLQTEGWEFVAGWKDKIGDVKYGLKFNVYDNETEITKYDNPAGLISNFYVGQTIGEIWGYETDGFYTVDDFVEGTLDAHLSGVNRQLKDGVVAGFPTQGVPFPGDVKYVDQDGDGIIDAGSNTLEDPGDRKIIGNSRRKYIYAITGNASYKGFDLSFNLTGVAKRDRDIVGDLDFPYISQFDNLFKHQLDYWTPDNQDAFYPRMYGDINANPGDRGNYGFSQQVQTKYLYSAAYLRIKNITVGYTFPESIAERINFTKIRIYVSGENLHTFTDLPEGVLPDQSVSVYPVMRNIAFGAQLSF
ncbi:MAG: TonB-dependent receptor [Reichenbachiella sp.]|uniref:SusC/RagA family TonB-linked outer membrane protein n=1 Tax=Reichenbachiella sp. TaxID=2184521 RepID=UPI0032970780